MGYHGYDSRMDEDFEASHSGQEDEDNFYHSIGQHHLASSERPNSNRSPSLMASQEWDRSFGVDFSKDIFLYSKSGEKVIDKFTADRAYEIGVWNSKEESTPFRKMKDKHLLFCARFFFNSIASHCGMKEVESNRLTYAPVNSQEEVGEKLCLSMLFLYFIKKRDDLEGIHLEVFNKMASQLYRSYSTAYPILEIIFPKKEYQPPSFL